MFKGVHFCVKILISHVKVAFTERGNMRSDATKTAELFTHFLPQKYIPPSIPSIAYFIYGGQWLENMAKQANNKYYYLTFTQTQT